MQLMNMVAEPLQGDPSGRGEDGGSVEKYGGSVEEYVRSCGCDGIEVIYCGSEDFCSQNKDIIKGYHLMFYADWLDFWNNDTAELNRKFGSEEVWNGFYGGGVRDVLIRRLQEDLDRAGSLGAEYVVFHVSDVSDEEMFTYRWEHTDEEVIDAAARFINLLLDRKNYRFEFLMENLHWPGFTFTRPEMTERLLSMVNYRKKGIMLDTGHLMCTNLDLRDQDEGFRYIHRMLDEHGPLCRYIRGVHLHQSVTGGYVKRSMENPPVLADEYYKKFEQSYNHICRIDTHQAADCAGVRGLISRIAPEYLVHEIRAGSLREKRDQIRLQQNSLAGAGGAF